MATNSPGAGDRLIDGLRWVARLGGLAVVGMAVLFFVGTGGFNPLHLTARELVLMGLFWTAILGLGVAWRCEGIGGALTLGSLLLFYGLEWLFTGSFPRGWGFGVIALPALLFLCCAAWRFRTTRPAGAGGGQRA